MFWRNYFGQSDGFIWVIDAADELRMKEGKGILCSLLKEERLCGSPCLILLNKTDLVDKGDIRNIYNFLQLDSVSMGGGSRNVAFYAVCALTGEGILQAVDWLHQKMTV